MKRSMVSIDGSDAAAMTAFNEVIAIYPITPSTVMSELVEAQQDVRDRWHAYERMAAERI
jgi:pyruvate-ferredoxin/flavodoxin oxidoreductase